MMVEEWAGLIGRLAACDRRYRRVLSRLRRTDEGAADVVAALEALAVAAQACADATDIGLTRRHFVRLVSRYEARAEGLRVRVG
jgi:CRP-like cAMP-binding protein